VIPRFALSRPRTIDEAFEAFAAADGEGAWIAGGTELLQVMKMGLAQFAYLIDLKALGSLRGIHTDDDGLHIGALTTHREIERSADLARAFPGMADMAHRVANVRVRATGTLGGNLAFAEPHSDPATLLLASGASVRLQGPSGARTVGIGDFVLGPLFTAREADEILTAVDIPSAGPTTGRAYGKFAFFERPAASVAVQLTVADGVIAAATVAVGSLTDIPELVDGVARQLEGVSADERSLAEAIPVAAEALGMLDAVDDLNGSPDYKRHLAGVLLASTGQAALREALAHA
jgi:carbon-monoxide dehydrogenase medium subunit